MYINNIHVQINEILTIVFDIFVVTIFSYQIAVIYLI